MAPDSSTLAWEIPWMEEPGRLQSMGLQSQTRLSDFTFTFHFHALEKEMATHSSVLAWRIPGDGKAWWAAICGVAQSWTRLKQLSSSSSRGPRLEDFAACFSFLAQTCCFMVQQSEGLALHLSCCEGCVVCKQKQKSGYCPPFTEQNPRSGQPSGAEQRLRGVLYFWEGGNYWAGEK